MHFISSGDISRLRFAILKVLTLTNLQVCCWLLFCTNSARNCSNPRKHRTRSTLFLHLQLFVTSCSAEPLYCAPLKTLRHRALDPSMSHSHLYIGWMRVFQRFLEHFFSILVHLVISPSFRELLRNFFVVQYHHPGKLEIGLFRSLEMEVFCLHMF